MLKVTSQTLSWLNFSLFQESKKLKHGSFLRHGGFSQAPYYSLNFGALPEDDSETISKNHQKAAAALNLSTLYLGWQCHGKKVIEVTPQLVSNQTRIHCDALMTDQKGVGLMIKHADCQASIFYDPIHHVLGMAHCGWRGSVLNIYAELIESMRARYGTNPSDLLVGISPSLGPNKAEFIHYKTELPPHFTDFQVAPTYFDFWAISNMQLIKAGVLPHHIEIAKMCTYELQDDFFSYRRDKITGRHATIAALC